MSFIEAEHLKPLEENCNEPLVLAAFGTVITPGAMASLGLAWAIRTGPFDDFRAGVASAFDEEELIALATV